MIIARRVLRPGLAACCATLIIAGCIPGARPTATPLSETPSPETTPTEAPTSEPSPTPTARATPGPGPTTPGPTPQPSPTPTATPLPTPQPTPFATPITTADIVERIAPAVVHIQVNGFSGPGTGTGVVLDRLGRILTNQHVIDQAREIFVTLSDDRVFEAQVVGEDPAVDIAVLRIDPSAGGEPPEFGDAGALRVGDDVIAIGHALALPGGPTVSKGVVSALNRSINASRGLLTDLIQTDAGINSGNSGGPLVNMRGEVVGINTAEIPGERIGFAITINAALQVAELLIVEGNRPTPDMGFDGINITPALAQLADLPVTRGVGIVGVTRGGPADEAGLRVDDIIIEIDGRTIRDLTDLSQLLRQRDPGQTINVTLVRGQDVYAGPVVLGAQPTPVATGPTGGT